MSMSMSMVTAKLICVFVFAYAKRWFPHDAAHVIIGLAHPYHLDESTFISGGIRNNFSFYFVVR